MQIVLDPSPRDADTDVLLAGLIAYNEQTTGIGRGYERLGLFIKDDAGNTLGGLSGRTLMGWLFIDMLFVPENLRGQDFGTQLMARAETFARERKLGGIWLDTFSFQARPFYERLGYEVFGSIPDYPPGGARHFLSKRL